VAKPSTPTLNAAVMSSLGRLMSLSPSVRSLAIPSDSRY
jgi:hypothetical protein